MLSVSCGAGLPRQNISEVNDDKENSVLDTRRSVRDARVFRHSRIRRRKHIIERRRGADERNGVYVCELVANTAIRT